MARFEPAIQRGEVLTLMLTIRVLVWRAFQLVGPPTPCVIEVIV